MAGGVVSVPLSVGSPRLGVTQRPALWSSDFPQPPYGDRGRLAHSRSILPQAMAARAEVGQPYPVCPSAAPPPEATA